jgi:uncharacterized protein (TIGR02145 family)
MKLKTYLLSLLGILLFCNNNANAQQYPTELVGYYKSTSGNSDFIGLHSDGFGKMNIAGFTTKTVEIAWGKKGNELIEIAYDADISAVLCSWQKKGNGIILNFPVPMGRSLTFTRGDVNAGSSNNNSGNNSQLPTSNTKTVIIGTQVWATKNLDVTTFRNGDPIPEAKTAEEWVEAGKTGKPAWCYYNNDPANGLKFGRLYNWWAVNDSRGIAPLGYHVPTDEEWTVLTTYLGGESDAGTKMKSTFGWGNYGNGSNSSGFSGLSAGARLHTGAFGGVGGNGTWWTSTEGSMKGLAWFRDINSNNGNVLRQYTLSYCGFAVRFIKDKQ